MKVSLNYRLPISLYYSTCKVTLSHSLIPSTADSLNSDLRRLASTLLTLLYFYSLQPLASEFGSHISGTDHASQKTQLFHCCLRVRWGSHVIATQPVHWHAGCCLATVPGRTYRKHPPALLFYCCVTSLLTREPA
jgi:hypothetical protein